MLATEAIRLDPEYALAFNNRGNVWRIEGDPERAQADYDEAIRLDPAYAQAFNNRGVSWSDKGDLDQAIGDYDEAIRLDPSYAEAYNNRGVAWRNKGDLDRAIADYGEALRLNRNDPIAHNNRCWAGAILSRDLPGALEDCNESLQLRPAYAYAFAGRGLIWLKLNQIENALADYDAALKLFEPDNPDRAYALYGRGMAKLRKEDKTGAQADLVAASRIKSDVAERFGNLSSRALPSH